MKDFNADLNDVLRYAMVNVENLMGQLASPEHNRLGGAESRLTTSFRGVLADALQEQDRETEANLLRQKDQHVLVHEGKVRAARFNHKPISAANRFIENLEGSYDCDVGFGMGWEPDSVEEDGRCLVHGDMADPGIDASPLHISKFGERFDATLRRGLADRNQTEILNDPFIQRHLHKVTSAPYEEIDHSQATAAAASLVLDPRIWRFLTRPAARNSLREGAKASSALKSASIDPTRLMNVRRPLRPTRISWLAPVEGDLEAAAKRSTKYRARRS